MYWIHGNTPLPLSTLSITLLILNTELLSVAYCECWAHITNLLLLYNLSSAVGIIYCEGLHIILWSDIIHKRGEIT